MYGVHEFLPALLLYSGALTHIKIDQNLDGEGDVSNSVILNLTKKFFLIRNQHHDRSFSYSEHDFDRGVIHARVAIYVSNVMSRNHQHRCGKIPIVTLHEDERSASREGEKKN